MRNRAVGNGCSSLGEGQGKGGMGQDCPPWEVSRGHARWEQGTNRHMPTDVDILPSDKGQRGTAGCAACLSDSRTCSPGRGGGHGCLPLGTRSKKLIPARLQTAEHGKGLVLAFACMSLVHCVCAVPQRLALQRDRGRGWVEGRGWKAVSYTHLTLPTILLV